MKKRASGILEKSPCRTNREVGWPLSQPQRILESWVPFGHKGYLGSLEPVDSHLHINRYSIHSTAISSLDGGILWIQFTWRVVRVGVQSLCEFPPGWQSWHIYQPSFIMMGMSGGKSGEGTSGRERSSDLPDTVHRIHYNASPNSEFLRNIWIQIQISGDAERRSLPTTHNPQPNIVPTLLPTSLPITLPTLPALLRWGKLG